jgi:predicted membrane chloride channel (bestrophin family)
VRNPGMVREFALTPWLFKILSFMLCSILISLYLRFRENSSARLDRYERKQIF